MRKSNAQASREVTLWSLRNEPNVSLDARIDVAKRLLTAIARMHERKLVHGRLEPSAIRLRGVRSFRVEVSVDEAPSSGVRDLRYTPPERDSSMLGDVYALGVILGELLDDAPESLRSVLSVMIEANPTARYASALVAMNAFARVAPSSR
jgi:hypothetical protein